MFAICAPAKAGQDKAAAITPTRPIREGEDRDIEGISDRNG
jgi:hypothetical protein